ncbi:sigma factor [Streptomyces meridianus]|uniref:RNA polymerase subunit sigma-24 n=1 Tax=Streptomyces meridianus TaxID=2938945 RepID=A0ABT0XDE5_9ACTN|nr:sigma factor [Streptomyces meridianus]MCM2580554.1 RNA polymerase subunit sigma-24 [Streptomyces meridianus]
MAGAGSGPGAGSGERRLPPSDSALIARTRRGDEHAYAELCRRHVMSVRRYARSCCRDGHAADDLTGEVFARTLQALRRGAGPDTAVRAHLLSTVRRVAASWATTSGRAWLVDDFAAFAGRMAQTGGPGGDTVEPGPEVRALHEAERTLVVKAFRRLPERWQTVLWHTTVENEPPARAAVHLGLTADAAAALARRAREGLRQAYLQAHISASRAVGGDCARFSDRMGTYVRGGLRMRAERGLRQHLAACARCRPVALEVQQVNARLRTLLPVAVIGWFASDYTLDTVGAATGAASAAAESDAPAAAHGTDSGIAGPTRGGHSAGRPGIAVRAAVATAVAAIATAGVFVMTAADGVPERRQAGPPVSALPTQPPHDRTPPGDQRNGRRPETAPASPGPPYAAPGSPEGPASGVPDGTGGSAGRTTPLLPAGKAPDTGARPPAPPSGPNEVPRPCDGLEVDLQMPLGESSTLGVTLGPDAKGTGTRGGEGSEPDLVCD